ncbi:MAG: dTMP kinase [Prevotellaceae bacterium]|jgi:dTMP kinase|nr:dTMP kinase [Prevotellaceae bacterium]
MLTVIEGLDGAGKTTQVSLLRKYFAEKNIESYFLHFPRFDNPTFGPLIAAFLRGEFGDVHSVNPQIVALLYAGDRYCAAESLKTMLDNNIAVILDRYVYSNIAFQCAKLADIDERARLREWIFNLEYNCFHTPEPDISIFLDVPFQFTSNKLKMQRKGQEREYLQGKSDIHEADLDLQHQVREVYLEQTALDSNFVRIDCTDNGLKMKKPEIISSEIIAAIKSRNLI